MGNKPKNVLSNIMTKRQYWRFVMMLLKTVFVVMMLLKTKVAFCLLVFI